jgi:hypothetical protein
MVFITYLAPRVRNAMKTTSVAPSALNILLTEYLGLEDSA